MWTWFTECSEEMFVNCYFGTGGACLNPKHRKGFAESEVLPAPKVPKKRLRERDMIFREEKIAFGEES
jgi:hypothetical protein